MSAASPAHITEVLTSFQQLLSHMTIALGLDDEESWGTVAGYLEKAQKQLSEAIYFAERHKEG